MPALSTVKRAGTGKSTIQRAANTPAATIEHMGIDHCSAHILVSQQFLDSADIVAILKEVRGEAVPQGVTADRLAELAA